MADGPRLKVVAKLTLKKFNGDVPEGGLPPDPIEIIETEEVFDLFAIDVLKQKGED
jgi:hypothetical protein